MMSVADDSDYDWDEDWGDEDYEEEGDHETIKCPECGSTVYAIADRCPQCGHWFLDEEKATGVFKSRAKSDLRSPTTIVLVAIGLLIILLLAVQLFTE